MSHYPIMAHSLGRITAAVLLAGLGLLAGCGSDSQDNTPKQLTLIHMGDVHGHLIPRPNLRRDMFNNAEGGLARMYTLVDNIRKQAASEPQHRSLLFNTGDTIQGSAEALFTRGQALVDVLNAFAIDGFAPGNWDFVYGTARFKELFAGDKPVAPWGGVAANVRNAPAAGQPCSSGSYVLPPYIIKDLDGLKVGILGFTTDRGPQVVGTAVTAGLCFLSSAPTATNDVSEVESELRTQVNKLREVEKVDLVVVLSELGLANNALLAKRNNGIDVVFSADMHEETPELVVVTTPNGGKTLLAEQGQDGTRLGELRLNLQDKKIATWTWKSHVVDANVAANERISQLVADARKPFVSGASFRQHTNPFNKAVLRTPIDSVVGNTQIGLHRSNFVGAAMPGVIEGTSHNFLTDAFRTVADADIGAIRGFRYGTHVAPGPIKLEDLYHFMPIGPRIAKGTITGTSLKNQIESAADGSLNPDPRRWTGGWLFNFSNVTMDLDAYQSSPNRASNIRVGGAPLEATRNYTYASYWYDTDPTLINRVNATNISVAVRDPDTGKARFVPAAEVSQFEAMDATEVVAQYLQDNLGGTLTSVGTNRINLLTPLPPPLYRNPEVQPLSGVK